MKNRRILIIALSCTGLLSACANNYTFHSNLNSQAVETYFKPGTVVVFDESNLPKQTYQTLALVEGESCQAKANDQPASAQEARTQARLNAANIQANGLIVRRCTTFEQADNQCISRVSCVGHAIVLGNGE
ncbi:Rcs stress response system protein RcsF [Shewanella gelidii]|uniref:RcsF protein n=1 Tax=Shewanella gelidii TaxID=1642821 RepID=A0A917N7D3_9GAMM|nr:Rcs stress response system protein RcsF [Shewanella gelidii]MCL1097339.1 hypothetical protein [Shewanella gelidii]GGI74345.1 hypothetical protein GCM10009332_09810 [Shewanella gelidii]